MSLYSLFWWRNKWNVPVSTDFLLLSWVNNCYGQTKDWVCPPRCLLTAPPPPIHMENTTCVATKSSQEGISTNTTKEFTLFYCHSVWFNYLPLNERVQIDFVRFALWCVLFYELEVLVGSPLALMLKSNKTKLHGLSLRANYTDRATAASRRSDCQLLRIEDATWSAWRIPTTVFSVF
jgi:hypothetical protein